MMRAKRPRAAGPSGRTRSMSEDNVGDDYLLHMDPALMTERQQLAFLLRKTAQEQSGGDSAGSHSPGDSSDDDEEATPRLSKRLKKRIRQPKTSPRNGRKSVEKAAESMNHSAVRQPKHTTRKTSPRAGASKTSVKRLQVKTTSPLVSDSDDSSNNEKRESSKMSGLEKPSPSSTSDIAHVGMFDDHMDQPDFWSLHCALCSNSASPYDAFCDPLFLCTSCDKKYPTQRALGRV